MSTGEALRPGMNLAEVIQAVGHDAIFLIDTDRRFVEAGTYGGKYREAGAGSIGGRTITTPPLRWFISADRGLAADDF